LAQKNSTLQPRQKLYSSSRKKKYHKNAEKANKKVPIRPPKLPKVTNSGTTLPPLQQQRLPKTTSRKRLPPTLAIPHRRKKETALQLKLISNAVPTLTGALANKENNGGDNVGGGSNGSSSAGGINGKKLWKSHGAWVAIVGPTDFIHVVTTMQVQPVHSRRMATRATPLLTTTWAATTTGHLCIALLTLKKQTWHLMGSPSPPPEMDRGMTKQI
jgi:hypothetical protein